MSGDAVISRTRTLALAAVIALLAAHHAAANEATTEAPGVHGEYDGEAASPTQDHGSDTDHAHPHGDASSGSHGATEDVARPRPDTLAGVWSAIDAEIARLETNVKSGGLSSVHDVAFGIRDLVRALPPKSQALPDAKQKLLAGFVSRVDEHADNLDRFGDAGDADASVRELAELKNRLGRIRSLYSDSDLTPQAGADHHSDATAAGGLEKRSVVGLTPRTVTGEIVDSRCYLAKGATGPDHRDCAIRCIKEHRTAALRDEKDGKLYYLDYTGEVDEQRVLDSVAARARVSGRVVERDGRSYVEVDSLRREHGHGEPPHGGIVGMAGDRHLEVVTGQDGSVRVYVLDGFMDAVDVSQVTGTATIRSTGDSEREAAVIARGGEFLAVNDSVRIGRDEEITLDLRIGDEAINMTLPLSAGGPASAEPHAAHAH